MKSAHKLVLGILFVCHTLVTTVCANTPPPDVTVRYAFVPKPRLAEAVVCLKSALAIEAEWCTKTINGRGMPPYPLNLSPDYSIVVFVKCPARFALWGQLGIPGAKPEHSRLLNVSLSPGYEGTYVIDGGGLFLVHGIPPEPKRYTWIEFHSE